MLVLARGRRRRRSASPRSAGAPARRGRTAPRPRGPTRGWRRGLASLQVFVVGMQTQKLICHPRMAMLFLLNKAIYHEYEATNCIATPSPCIIKWVVESAVAQSVNLHAVEHSYGARRRTFAAHHKGSAPIRGRCRNSDGATFRPSNQFRGSLWHGSRQGHRGTWSSSEFISNSMLYPPMVYGWTKHGYHNKFVPTTSLALP